tara:strand:+ start:31 stop:723 length:693 start_codon:yes stop_codon:yes gene_type:complete
MFITVIIPCYNEKATIKEIVNKVNNYNDYKKEVIIVDDGSTDGTKEILEKEIKQTVYKIIYHEQNLGKGAAISSALNHVNGEVVIIQDADLEYDPKDYTNLLRPFLEKKADIVLGSRFLGGVGPVRIHFFWHYVANKILTLICNIFINLNISDMETGFKLFKTKAIKSIKLYEKSFGFEPEVVIKLAKKNFIFYEVPVSYYGRSYEEGKKIRLKDAFTALYCIVKYSIFD